MSKIQGYPIERLVDAALDDYYLKPMTLYATSQVGSDVKVVRDRGDRCFSRDSYWDKAPTIFLGAQFFSKAFPNALQVVPYADVKAYYKHVSSCYIGAYYHELFHLLYTPFQYILKLLHRCNYTFQEYVMIIINILEDKTIETSGKYYYPKCILYLDELCQVFFQPFKLDELKEAIEKEPDEIATLISYLLLYVREVDLSSLPTYQLWEDNKDFIEWGAYKCINTKEANTRARRQCAYALQLLKIIKHEQPDKDAVENADADDLDDKTENTFPDVNSGIASSIIREFSKLSTDLHECGGLNNNPQDVMTSEEIDTKEISQHIQASYSKGSDDSESNELNVSPDLSSHGISILSSEDPILNIPHWAANLNDYENLSNFLPEYNQIVKECSKEIDAVVNQIRKMKATNNSSWNHYKMTGKLDMATIYKKGNYRVFKTKNAPKQEADLIVSILVDISGSMKGSKAKLAGRALIIFCEALNRLHIPFSVNCFTQGESAITICLKSFTDIYDRVKTNMTLLTNQVSVSKLSTWGCNVDEANLKYVASDLLKQTHEDKLIVVISDGATCGDKYTLKKVAESFEAKGITILGVGIYDHNVEEIYNKHTVISNQEDLQKLGGFLNKYLVKLTFKGGR